MKLFCGINKLYTFAGFAKKQGRRVSEGDYSCIEQAALVEEKGKIIWAGIFKNIPAAYKSRKVKKINLKNKNVFPGFIDCHTHSVFAGNRKNEFERRINGETYQQIAKSGGGIASTVMQTRMASEKELIVSRNARLLNFIQQGVTTVEIKSGYGLDKENELKILKVINSKSKIRVVPTFLGAHSIPKEFASAKDYLIEVSRWLDAVKKLGFVNRLDIFIEKNYFEPEFAEVYLKKAKELGFELSVHAEQLSWTGGIELAIRLNAKSVDHVVCASDQDIINISQSDLTAVLLPTSDFYLDIDYPKARKIIDNNGRVALSTDFNPGSSPTQNINFLGLLSRLKLKMSLPEIFSALTVGPAHVLGLQDQIGSLEVKKSCDFFTSDWDVEDFFYDLSKIDIYQVWSRGDKIY